MNNNLRISHESLDMDDIISDLNPSSQGQSIQTAQPVGHKPAEELPSFRTQKSEPKTTALKSPKGAKVGQPQVMAGTKRPMTGQKKPTPGM